MKQKFTFKQFEPSVDLRLFSNTLLEKILDRSPSDAEPIAEITKRKEGFEAVLELFSQAGHFIVRSVEKTPERALSAIKREMEKQLSRWRNSRFFETSSNAFLRDKNSNFEQQPGGFYGTCSH